MAKAVQNSHAGPFWAQFCRIGEAQNPGPWSLSAINPTGLAGKAAVFDELIQGIHSISETHLSCQGITRFRNELKGNRSPNKLVAGHPAPYRTNNLRSVGGKHTGVAFVSPYPSRQLAHGWQRSLYTTSRLAAAAFWVGSSWIFGGVAYGFAHDAHTKEVQMQTDELLQELTQQVVHSGQPLAFVAGDWNQEPGVLSEPLKWEQKGWKDVQTLARQRWGIQEVVTCKHATRKDFLYLSPGLQELLMSVTTTWDHFTDHSCLQAILKEPSVSPLEARWFKPRPISYEDDALLRQLQQTHMPDPDPSESMTQRYMDLCTQLEQHVEAALQATGKPALMQQQKGRGTVLHRTFHRVPGAPLKASREGDMVPEYVGPNLRYITQARRLSSYVQLVRTGRQDPQALEQKVRVWNAVLRSSGFGKSFSLWWPTRALQGVSSQTSIPQHPPNFAVASDILQAFNHEVTHFG